MRHRSLILLSSIGAAAYIFVSVVHLAQNRSLGLSAGAGTQEEQSVVSSRVSSSSTVSELALAHFQARPSSEDERSEPGVDFPFLGRVKSRPEPLRSVTWNVPEVGNVTLPFTFWRGENGVWIRAEYQGSGEQYPERTAEDLKEWYYSQGEEITGVPANEGMSLGEALALASKQLDLTKASRIVVDHVLFKYNPEVEPEAAVIVKVWGVENAHHDQPDLFPRVRLVLLPKSDFGLRDDLL